MRRILKVFFVLCTILIVSNLRYDIVFATDVDCNGKYEVTTAQTGGGFSGGVCFDSYSDAVSHMNTLTNDISNTPVIKKDSKIIKMRGGIIDISNASITEAIGVYATETINTTEILINGIFGGEMGYINSSIANGELVRIKGKISGVEGWIKNDTFVKLIPTAHLNIVNKYYIAPSSDPSVNTLYHSRTYNKFAWTGPIGAAPSWMAEGTDYYSFDGVNFYTDYFLMSEDLVNKSNDNVYNTFYNYYQYLSPRTRSNYNANDLNNHVDKYLDGIGISNDNKKDYSVLYKQGAYFIKAQEENGVNALMEFAWAVHESAYGTSKIAREKLNIFGIGAVDSAPVTNANPFTSVEECIHYHSRTWVSVGYSDPISDSRFFGSSLGNKLTGFNVKYATDPYWGEGIAGQMYKIDEALGFKDLNYYTLGIIQNGEVKNVEKDSKVLYKTWNEELDKPISNYPLTIIGENDTHYEIMTDSAIKESEEQDCTFISYSKSEDRYKVYDFSSKYQIGEIAPACTFSYSNNAIIEKSNITLTNASKYNNPYEIAVHKTNIYETTFDGKIFNIKGRLILTGFDMTTEFNHSKKLILKGINDNIYSFNLIDIDSYKEIINNVNYTYAGFTTNNIDFSILEDDTYSVYVQLYDEEGYLLLESKLSDDLYSAFPDSVLYGLSKGDFSSINSNLVFSKSSNEPLVESIISDFSFNKNTLHIFGSILKTGYELNLVDNHSKKILFKDKNGDVAKEVVVSNINLGNDTRDYFNYDYKGYDVTIGNLDDLGDGQYNIFIELYDSSNNLIHSEQLKRDAYSKSIPNHVNEENHYSILDSEFFVLDKLYQEDEMIIQYLQESSLEGDILTLKGYAFMLNIDNTPSEVVHNIVLKNESEEYKFKATSHTGDYDLSKAYNHGFDYSKTWYEININVNDIVPGDYIMYVEVSTNDHSGIEEMLNAYHVPQPNYSDIGTKSLEYYLNPAYHSRMELSIANHNLLFDKSKINGYTTIDYLNNVYFEDNKLNIQGYSFIPHLNNEISDYKMYLIQSNGNIHEMTRVPWDGLYDLTKAYNDGYDYGNPWYHFEIDLDSLPSDDYIIKMVVYQNGNELFSEVINAYNKDYSVPYVYNNSTYTINTNSLFRYRIELNKK